ncbi:MAG: FxsA family protein [Thermoanaerobaculia bacterium]|nr:FxsA family protein [Thermoanaerobaculia bacterium]
MQERTVLLSSQRSGCGCLAQLFLLFTLVPLTELWLLLLLGRNVGLVPTLALVILTGALGAWLARSQGLRAFAAVQAELNSGRMPTSSLLDGLLILIAGAVLLTPGLLTDVFGFLLLIPWTRERLRNLLAAELKRRAVSMADIRVYDRTRGRATDEGTDRFSDEDERVILVDDSRDGDHSG